MSNLNIYLKFLIFLTLLLTSCKEDSVVDYKQDACNNSVLKQCNDLYISLEKSIDNGDYESAQKGLLTYGKILDSIKSKINLSCYHTNKLKYHTDNIFIAYRTGNIPLGHIHIESSKKHVNSKHIDDRPKIRHYLLVGTFLNMAGNDSAYNYIFKAEELAKVNNDSSSILKSGLAIAHNYIMKGESEKCIQKIKYIKPYCMDDKYKANIYNMLGASYENLDKNKEALDNYLKCIDFAIKTNEIYTQKMVLHNISIIEKKLHLYDEALIHEDSCIAFAEKIKSNDLKLFYQNKAQILHQGFNRNEEAFEFLLKAKKLEGEQYQYLLLNDFSEIYQKLNRNDLAISSLIKCTEQSTLNKDYETLCISLIGLGELYGKLNQHKVAKAKLKSALNIYSKHLQKPSLLLESYSLLERTEIKSNNYQEGYKWGQLKDSIKKVIDSIKYHSNIILTIKDNKNLELSELNNRLNKDRIKLTKANNKYFNCILLLLILLFIFIILMFIYSKKKKSLKNIIKNQSSKLKKLTKKIDIAKQELHNNYEKINTLKSHTLQTTKKDIDIKEYLKNNDWINYSKYFEDSFPGFLTQLKLNFDDLNQNDLKLCSLIKLNLTNKEIATLLSITDNGVKKARQRLKHKLNLDNSLNINHFLMNL
jgi:hypothetical protein